MREAPRRTVHPKVPCRTARERQATEDRDQEVGDHTVMIGKNTSDETFACVESLWVFGVHLRFHDEPGDQTYACRRKCPDA